ncbi:MAG: ArgE/DapE family deacylase [Acidobacteriota bacterium]
MDDQQTLELARDLIRIESVNPGLVLGAAGEEELARFVHRFLTRRGIEARCLEVEPGRPNVLARLPGNGGGPNLLLCCHMDTVSVEGMEEPFSGRIENGRIYGRGAHDVKGGLAAMLAAAVALSGQPRPGGGLLLAAVVDEEYRSCGTEALLELLKKEEERPQAAVVFEPSDLQVLVAHKGFAWFCIETRGVAAHGSRPQEGVDAIAHMGRLLVLLEEHGRELESRTPHALIGPPSLHASLIEGGRELSSYPDRCRLDIERRTVPGESEADVRAEVESLLDRLSREDSTFHARSELTFLRPPFEISVKHALPQGLARALTQATGRPARFGGLTAWTDSALMDAAGIPSVVFGPGGSGLHSLKEYGLVQDIFDCRDALIVFATSFCKRE